MIDNAPWIREAELNGIPEPPPPPHCPICGQDTELFYLQNGEIIGCENCIESADAYDMAEEEE